MVDHAVRRPLSRRTFLKTGAATSGALVLGVYLPDRKAAAAPAGASSLTPNAFVRIDAQGRVTLVMPMVEMGQGIYTAQAIASGGGTRGGARSGRSRARPTE